VHGSRGRFFPPPPSFMLPLASSSLSLSFARTHARARTRRDRRNPYARAGRPFQPFPGWTRFGATRVRRDRLRCACARRPGVHVHVTTNHHRDVTRARLSPHAFHSFIPREYQRCERPTGGSLRSGGWKFFSRGSKVATSLCFNFRDTRFIQSERKVDARRASLDQSRTVHYGIRK